MIPHTHYAPSGPIHGTALLLLALIAGCATPIPKAAVIPTGPFVLTVRWENLHLPAEFAGQYYTGLETSSNLRDWSVVRSNDYADTNSARFTNPPSPMFIRAFNRERSQ